jgi:D-glycero-D-manno-heptose 1,7-bisphosphate phosphatase
VTPAVASLRPAVFFDRDGVVNESPGGGYVTRWEDLHLLPGFVAALRVVAARGYGAVVVTNQKAVHKGLLTAATVESIHANLRRLLRERHGLDVLDILYCPHGDGECDCRKPQPGMLLRAAERHGLDLRASWMVGDQWRDVEAGRRAGCRTILVGAEPCEPAPDSRAGSVDELAALLERLLPDVSGSGVASTSKTKGR